MKATLAGALRFMGAREEAPPLPVVAELVAAPAGIEDDRVSTT
jgi:hypothetical protein